ncbi:M16 family metallopeptidase [Tsuneonella mangrovi]|uniref:M16 family metallopeptidase n=1 Tax=Tsuneonella mangrovi TaxID=1982042 RepID=UPI001F0B4211|nr:pitrilysin family protein [Tsuneonella mangrovi]
MNFRIARRSAATSLLALSLATVYAAPALAADAPADDHSTLASAPAPAPVSQLIDAVSIPYESFKLDNGLTVLVHTDHAAPVVAVSVWYGVGSKNEPKGKTGFAHLFEHLMFNGSEHAPGDFFEPLQQVGATDFNGTTWFDRTNYFETVPTAALDTALFLESDRMGYLLGAVTQDKLDNQIGVVQNEKRQGDNQPYGLVEYEELENLYPVGHPYHHSTIGSMKDLSGATLSDVKGWFKDHYGSNNAILVLAGDVDLATAKEKVIKWFGAIPAGPKVEPVSAPVPTLPATLDKTIYDKIATPRVYRMWAIPGLDNPDYIPLTMGATVLGGLASSRLDDALVRQQQVAVRVSASADIFAQAGQFVIYADAKPGVSEEELGKALDAEIAKFIANGPTADELQRATTVYAASQIRGLDHLGGFNGKAPTLAQGLLYNGDPAHYKAELEAAAALTPAKVKAITAEYLKRPAFELTIEPGTRKAGGEDRGGWGPAPLAGANGKNVPARHPAYFMAPDSEAGVAFASEAERSKVPEIGQIKPLQFPKIERATLSNGMQVFFARRDAVPAVTVKVDFDAGYAADPRDKLGLQSLMLQAMDEGTTDLDPTQLAIAKERLGATLDGYANLDQTSFGLNALAPNLAASFDLLADYIRHPAFRESDLERVRTQQLTRIRNELNNPGAIAQRALMPLIYGDHPYGIPPSGSGDPDVVAKLTRADLMQFHDTWLRPDRAKVFVVGDTTLAEVTKLLEASFGSWQNPAGPAPAKDFTATIPQQKSRVILIDRPASPQSVIYAGRVLPEKGTDDLVVLDAANEVFGGSFLSRINMDIRETKGWSYGVRSTISQPVDLATFTIYAPVQADRTGDSIVALRKDLDAYTNLGEGVTAEELTRLVNGNVRELPGRFETSRGVLNGMVNIIEKNRADDYYETLGAKYAALTASQLDAAAKADLKGSDLVFVVVGDAKKVAPQLEQLGLPVEVREPAGSDSGVDSHVSKGD